MFLEVLFGRVVVAATAFVVAAAAGGVKRLAVVVDVVGERMRVVAVRAFMPRGFGLVFLQVIHDDGEIWCPRSLKFPLSPNEKNEKNEKMRKVRK